MIGLDPVFQSYRSVRAAMPGHGSQQAACAVRFTVLFHAAHKDKEAESLYREGVGICAAVPRAGTRVRPEQLRLLVLLAVLPPGSDGVCHGSGGNRADPERALRSMQAG